MTTHIVALSGGKDSTAMALRLRELEPATPFEFVCTPTGNELSEMVAHWAKLQDVLGTKLRLLGSGDSLGSLIDKWNALPNWRQRWCTRVLKIEPFEKYVASNMPCVVYVGIRADEADREGVEYKDTRIERRFPLIEWTWGVRDVLDFLERRGITIPRRTDCAACFFQTLGEWYTLWNDHPNQYAEAEAWEAKTEHTFRSPSRDTQPAGLIELRQKFERGYAPQKRSMADRPSMCSVCAR